MTRLYNDYQCYQGLHCKEYGVMLMMDFMVEKNNGLFKNVDFVDTIADSVSARNIKNARASGLFLCGASDVPADIA